MSQYSRLRCKRISANYIFNWSVFNSNGMASHFITIKICISRLCFHVPGFVCFLLLCRKKAEHPCKGMSQCNCCRTEKVYEAVQKSCPNWNGHIFEQTNHKYNFQATEPSLLIIEESTCLLTYFLNNNPEIM